MNEELVVIKVGGSCLKPGRGNVAEQITSLIDKRPFILVHGYGPELRHLLSTLGVERPSFISASGVPSHQTTEEIAELSALAAYRVRKILASQFDDAGISTKAIPAFWNGFVVGSRKECVRYIDNGVVRARKGDFAGRVAQVNIDLLSGLREESRGLIVSAILRGAKQETLVIDADHLAVEIALALNVTSIYMLSDQPGVLANGVTVPKARSDEITELAQYATGGMARKLKHIKTGLKGGIDRVFLLDGVNPILNGAPHGTVFVRS
jgi:acetylglutamate kinase